MYMCKTSTMSYVCATIRFQNEFVGRSSTNGKARNILVPTNKACILHTHDIEVKRQMAYMCRVCMCGYLLLSTSTCTLCIIKTVSENVPVYVPLSSRPLPADGLSDVARTFCLLLKNEHMNMVGTTSGRYYARSLGQNRTDEYRRRASLPIL